MQVCPEIDRNNFAFQYLSILSLVIGISDSYVLNQQIQFPAISVPSLCVIPFMIKLLLFKKPPCSKIVQLFLYGPQHTIS